MGKFVDLTGQRFYMLTVLEQAPSVSSRTAWKCQCDCGTIKVVAAVNLGRGTTSCGCYRRENTRRIKTTHGNKPKSGGTPEYHAWVQMKLRTSDPTRKDAANYILRGISVCKEWEDSFETFLLDMGCRPSPSHSLDRIDNNLGYSKENCRWATRTEQSRNRRSNKVLNYHGTEVRLIDLAEQLGMDAARKKKVTLRIWRGWSHDSAVDTP